MNIKELLSSGANVTISVTPADLKEFALFLKDEWMMEMNQRAKRETYLTPDEVASELGVSKNTLWRWEKRGYLIPIKVGRKPFYKRSDVDSLLSNQQT